MAPHEQTPPGLRGSGDAPLSSPGGVAVEGSRGFNGLVWRSWPFAAWLLPPAVFLMLWLGESGGWEMLILLLASPLLLPAMALLGLLPRWIRRRRLGIDGSNTPLSVSLIVHWWSLVLLAASHRGIGDSGSVDSLLGEAFFELREPLEMQLFGTAILLLLGSYASVFACAMLPAGGGGGAGGGSSAKRPWYEGRDAWTGVAMLLVPALMAGGIAGGIALGKADAERTIGALEARWEEMQQRAAPLRAGIAPADWYLSGGGARETDGAEAGGRPGSAYRVSFSWQRSSDEPLDAVLERARGAAESQGWKLRPSAVDDEHAVEDGALPGTRTEFVAEDETGYELLLRAETRETLLGTEETALLGAAEEAGEEAVRETETLLVLSLASPPIPASDDLWIDWRARLAPEERETELDPREAWAGPVQSFSAEEWPSLAHAASTMFW